jgi:hypothetical protein
MELQRKAGSLSEKWAFPSELLETDPTLDFEMPHISTSYNGHALLT